MTYRFGRTNKIRYAAIVSGIPAYTGPNVTAPVTAAGLRGPVSLKATNHLTAPTPVAPVPVAPARDTSWMIPCGEEGVRKYSQVPKRRKRRLKKKGRRRKSATTRSKKCDDLYDSSQPFGGTAYQDCIIKSAR